ncbi:hypothetical protein M9Y10_042484 [Tritrichomonas musculus]|uniref:Uncharacterized protein n=1 Tax=Tritrichomonas musculus TaxID=1915356 RepID=A0ABR2GNT2_9EUKA
MIHAVKMFVIPSLDFIIVNGQLKIEDIEKLDSMIRSLINKKVGRNILLAVKHGSWNDGGLSIPSIRNMGEVGKVKSLIRMLSNKDPDIRTLAEAAIESEMHVRNVVEESDIESQCFFNWKEDINHSEHSETNSIVQRARNALKRLDLRLTFARNNGEVEEKAPQNLFLKDTSLDKSLTFNSCMKVPCFIKSFRRERWKSKLSCNSEHAFHSKRIRF